MLTFFRRLLGQQRFDSPCPTSLQDVVVVDTAGRERPLREFLGAPLLIVNTASRCGFTAQYKGLEEMHRRFHDRGLRVLGFPSNDFLGQEPGTEAEIQSFCELNFGVTFPLFAKRAVRGAATQPLFRFLTEMGPRKTRGAVRWNFEKFLVDRSGAVAGRWRSFTPPTAAPIIAAIERVL